MAKTARTVPVVSVKSRHRAECRHKGDGNKIKCDCPKQLVWSRNGKEHRISADTCDYEVAEGKAREMENSFARAAKGEPEPEKIESITVEDAVDKFIGTKRDEGVGERSLLSHKKTFKKDLVTYCHSHGLMFLRDIKLTDLEAWRGTWNLGKSTAQKNQSRVVGFFHYALERGWVDRNIALGMGRIRLRDEDRKPTLALTDEQFQHVLDCIAKVNGRTTDDQRKAFRGLVLLQRWTGLAIGDAVKLERAKLEPDPENGGWYRVFLRRAKTGVPVYAALAPEIAAEILAVPNSNKRYLFCSGPDEVFNSKQRWTDMYAKLNEVAALKNEHGEPMKLHSHMLRDTFAVWCLNNDLSVEDVAALLGHANINITQKHYLPWISSRAKRLAARVKHAYQVAKGKEKGQEQQQEQQTQKEEQTQAAGA